MKMLNGLIAAAVAMVLVSGSASAGLVSSQNGKLAPGVNQATYIYDDLYSVEVCDALLTTDLKRWAGAFNKVTKTVGAADGKAMIKGNVDGVKPVVQVSMTCKAHKKGVKVIWYYNNVILTP